ALGVGVERGAERALARRHLACKPSDRLARALPEQRIAAALMRQRQELEQLGVVVEHLLEVRHEPALVDRVAGKSAAQMVVDAALADSLERVLDQVEEPRVVLPQAGAPKHFIER